MPNQTYTPSEMAAAISTIGQAALQNKTTQTVTQNGDVVVTPDNGYDGMSEVTVPVNVPSVTVPVVLFSETKLGKLLEDNHYVSGRSNSGTITVSESVFRELFNEAHENYFVLLDFKFTDGVFYKGFPNSSGTSNTTALSNTVIRISDDNFNYLGTSGYFSVQLYKVDGDYTVSYSYDATP